MNTEQQNRAVERAERVTDLATKKAVSVTPTSERVGFNNDGTIKQTERLLTARPRYAPMATSQAQVYDRSVGSRGTHAYIKLLTSSAQATAYTSSRGARGAESPELTGPGSFAASMVSSDSASGYDSFLVTRVSCQMQEKLQVTEVFGDGEVAYYFGRQPLMFSIGGVLIDSPDNSWFTDWLKMYSGFLRGSQLAQNHELLRLVLPNMVLTGTISATSWDQESSNDVGIQFSFQFLAKRVEPTAPVPQSVAYGELGNLIDFGKAASFVSQEKINSLKSQVASLTSIVKDPKSTTAQIGAALSGLGSGVGGSLGFQNTTLTGAAAAVKNWVGDNDFSKGLASAASLFKTVSANLNGIRTQLFSPIYGVLTSLTRLVRNTSGNVNTIFNSLFTPVRNILRDITNISNQAVALVNLVNNSIRGVGRNINRQIGTSKEEFDRAMKAVGRAGGAIATSPMTALQSVQLMFRSGSLSAGSAFLSENRRASLSGGASLAGGGGRPDYKIAILRGSPSYQAAAGGQL